MFRLMRYFSLTSAVIVAGITVLFVAAFQWHQTSELFAQSQRRNMEMGRILANIVWNRHASYLTSVGDWDGTKLRSHPETAQIDAHLRDLTHASAVLKLKIYDPRGLTIYSSEARQIGEDKSTLQEFRNLVMTGHSAARMSHRQRFHALQGEKTNLDVVESYIPIFDHEGQTRMVFEVYMDISQEVGRIRRQRIDVALLTILALGFLYCSLLFIVRRAEIVLRRQYEELSSFNARMETEVAQKTNRLVSQQDTMSKLMKSERVRHGAVRDAMGALTRAVSESATVERVSIWQFNKDRSAIVSIDLFERTPRRHSEGVELKVKDFPAYFDAVLSRELIVADDAVNDDETREFADVYLKPLGIGAMLDAPIIVNGQIEGVLCLEHVGGPKKWSAETKLLVVAVANLAALVLERIDRSRMQNQLHEANAAAEQATRAKTAFLANMSHEIRTPMNGVLGMTEILLRTELDERQHRLVDTVQQSAKTLLTIINDILDISRIEAGKLELDSHDFDLRHNLEGALSIFEEQIKDKDVELSLFAADDIPNFVKGDAVRLRQVLINLVGNAVKFTNKGEVSLRATSVGRCDGRDMVRFEIRDTGIGIDPAVKNRLFQPFAQANSNINRQFGGTGLGLSISKHLVEMMGGQIRIESTPDVGTTVSFVLPVESVESSVQQLRPDIKILEGKRILIVDDRETNREIVASYLIDAGVETATADNAPAALAMIERAAREERPFAAAIVDVVMPGMSGLELAQTIRKNAALQDLRLALLTSLSWKGDTRLVRELGVETMLSKPIRRRELLDEVALLLGAVPASPKLDGHPAAAKTRMLYQARVLVAEDNPVNIEVAREFLSDFGCTVEIATDGREAVEAVRRGAFDMIFMDLQMPNMDGLAATAHIRAHQAAKSEWRSPIVGLTANAFAEDRERCLAADMDDYLSKPFTEAELSAVLERWISKKQRSANMTMPMSNNPTSEAAAGEAPALDMAMIANLQSGRPDLLKRLIKAYLGYAPKAVEGLQAATDGGVIETVRMTAHSLKSSTASMGAKHLSALFKEMEHEAMAGNLEPLAPLMVRIEAEFTRVIAELQALSAGEEPRKVAQG